LKHVLFITPEMPPRGSSESIRSIKTLKYISHFGWRPIVLTIKNPLNPIDKSLILELPEDISIIRAYSNKIFDTCMKGLGVIIPSLRLHDYYLEWLPFGILSGNKILKSEDIDLILSRSTPVASHIVAYILKSISNLPWIADFSDPWTLNPFVSLKIPILHGVEQSLERKVLSKADKIIVTTGRYRDVVVKQFDDIPDIEKKIVVIPNSYDPQDSCGVNQTISREDHCSLTMTYMGRFYGSRRPEYFFEALSLLKNDYEPLKINLKIIGGSKRDNISLGRLVERYGVNELVQILPPVSHAEAFNHLANSDVLLLIDAPSDRESMFLPMKLLEYLAIERPILALTPMNGESADIIRATRTGHVVVPTDIQGIKSAIEDYYLAFLNSELSIAPNMEEIKKYSIQNSVKKLVHEMNTLLDG